MECHYRQLVQALSHSPAQLQLAKVLHQQNRPTEALELFNSLLAGTDLPPKGPLRARAVTNRGALLQLQGDLAAAEVDHCEALRLDPGLKVAGDLMLALALELHSQGHSPRSIWRAQPQRSRKRVSEIVHPALVPRGS